MSEEAKGTAINTNVQLHEQGKTLNRIEDKLEDTNYELRKAEHSAKQITSFWYRIKTKVKRVFGYDGVEGPDYVKRVEDMTPEERQQYQYYMAEVACKQVEGTTGSEEDEILDNILGNVKQMRHCQKDLSAEVDRQKEQIDRIDKQMDKANGKVTKVNRILKKAV